MKVQYFGDVNDYRKFALLRALARGGFKVGVVWMLTPNDGRADGNNRSFVGRPEKWRAFDSELFDALKTVPAKPTFDDLLRVERERLVPGATFFNDPTPSAKKERAAWHANALTAMGDADLVFFDPDNGLSVASCPKGRRNSDKFVFEDELADHYAAGRSLLVYQHYSRRPRAELGEESAARLNSLAKDAAIWSFPTAHALFLLIAHPLHRAMAKSALASEAWPMGLLNAVSHSECNA